MLRENMNGCAAGIRNTKKDVPGRGSGRSKDIGICKWCGLDDEMEGGTFQ